MKKFLSTKYILSLIGIVLLGSLSNPAWDFVVKPLCVLLYKITLNISVLGLEVFKNQIYRDIAKGFHEHPSLQLYGIVLSCAIVAYLFLGLRLLKKKFTSQQKVDSPPLAKNYIFYAILLCCGFSAGFFFVQLTKESYINNAITHYNQLVQITKPYITQDEFDLYNSRFAQIRNKDDYSKLIRELEGIASEYSLLVPNFKFVF